MRLQLKRYLLGFGLGLVFPLLALAFTFTEFDYPGATITEAFGINDYGKVVGSFCTDGDAASTCTAPGISPSHGYLMDKGKFKAINYPGAFETEAIGINNDGAIVGLWDPPGVPAGSDMGHGFIKEWGEGFETVDYPGAVSTDLQGINSWYDVVGIFANTAVAPVDHGFLSSVSWGKRWFCSIDVPSSIIPGFIASDTNALGVNDNGDVVGSYDDDGTGTIRGFLLRNAEVPPSGSGPCQGEYSTFEYPGSGILQTEAAGINNAGVIVGNYLDSAQVSHGFRLAGGVFTTVDDPKSAPTGDNAATAINNKGHIVGNFEDLTLNPVKERAFKRF